MRNQDKNIFNHNSFRILFLLLTVVFFSANKVYAQFAISEDFRGSGNPNIIIGGPGGSAGMAYLTSGIDDPVNQGWLRLTTSDANQRGYAYINNSFPSTEGVLVDFEYKMWRDVNDNYKGADGLGVYLFDASVPFQIGGLGGSLGYAPNGGNGLAGGYVGVGFDAYGNFSNPTEGRVGGPGEVPNAVVLRGPTTNNSSTTNRYLAGVGLVNGGTIEQKRGVDEIDYNTRVDNRPDDDTFYRRVQLEIIPMDAIGEYYKITVRWKKSPTDDFSDLISYTTTDAPPPLLKLGFGASTGGGVNYHEIRNLLVTTPGNFRVDKRANKDILRSVPGSGSENQVTYTIEVINDTEIDALNVGFLDRLTDVNGDLIPEGNPGFNVTSITYTGFSSISLPTASDLDTNEITGTFSLGAGNTGKIYVTGTLTTIPAGNTLNNTATITPLMDDDESNNTSTVSIPVYAEGVDLLIARTVVDDLCLDPSNPTGKTFELRVANMGTQNAKYRRRGSKGERIVVTKVVPSGYTYDDSATNYTTNPDSNSGARWERRSQNNTPSNGYRTYTYLARYPTGNSDQILAAGAVYQTDYPIVYTITPPVGVTTFTDSAEVEYRKQVNNDDYSWGGVELQTITNQANDVNSVTLNAAPVAPIVSTPIYYCQGETASSLTATKTNTSYTLKWYTVPGGFASSTPFTPNTSSPGTYTFYVSQFNGQCEGPLASIDVIVIAAPTAGEIGNAQTICNGSAPSAISNVTSGIGTGTLTYRWESSANGTNGWTIISGATGATYQPGALTATTYYRRTTLAASNNKNCESGQTNIVQITVNNAISSGSIGSNQTICYGATPSLLTGSVSIDPGTITYRWESSADGSTGWTATGGTSNNYQPGTLTTTTYFRRITRSTSGGTTCESSPSGTVVITVNSQVTAGSIGSDQTICNGDTPAQLTSVENGTGTGNVTYRWESSVNGNIGWTIISGANDATYQPDALTVTTYYRRITIATSGTACESPATSSVKITVNAAVTAGTIGNNQSICTDTAPAIIASTTDGTGTGSITYRWESSDDGSTGWTTIAGATASTYQPGVLTASKYYRRITIATSGLACESSASNVVAITTRNCKVITNPMIYQRVKSN
ncbi:hypothetical protein V1389_10585 [Flavobacterium rakeshii]|uniref:hypothetical protein n=1 Tax=Flavobacterium rakeshii TaxID=1038845 RepID=UPI002E7BC21F|nr:hypothetical protein [Flavobacterium rakeshii]MEE1898785.1 hypothetical protein [Flavobacterium rakeshii]